MNKFYGIGNVATDVSAGVTSTGTKCTKFNLAINTKYKDNKRTDFIPIVTFAGLAENCERYLSKGSKVAVVGSLRIEPYEDTQGVKRTSISVIADEVEFLGAKKEDGTPKEAYKAPEMKMVSEEEAKNLPF